MLYYAATISHVHRWTLSIVEQPTDGRCIDIWAFSRCQSLDDLRPVHFDIHNFGPQVDYNPTAFGSIVVSKRMADIVETIAASDIQRIRAYVKGSTEKWEILNVLSCVDCIDHNSSDIQYYPPDHPRYPNEPRGIRDLALDQNKIKGNNIFTLYGWNVSVIVSESLKILLEEANITGINYTIV